MGLSIEERRDSKKIVWFLNMDGFTTRRSSDVTPHEAIEDISNSDYTDVTIRFKNVNDREMLSIDLSLLLESISDEGWILGFDPEE